MAWASYQIHKIVGCTCAENAGMFPCHWIQRKPLVSDPDMHHGACATHVPWCMSGSLTRVGRENVPGIHGTCATRNFMYLARGPWACAINSLAPGRCGSDYKIKTHARIKFTSTSCEITLRWMPQNTFGNKSTLVQVMAHCHHPTSHYLSQCWPYVCYHMVSLGHNELTYLACLWINISMTHFENKSISKPHWP